MNKETKERIMAKGFHYYDDDWQSVIFECPRCGWKGRFDEGSVELYEDLMDSSCPKCPPFQRPMLAIVSYPTLEESERNWAKLTDSERESVTRRKNFLEQWDRTCLKSTDQLPDLKARKLTLAWDYVQKGDASNTVVRFGKSEIWREPALFEGYERFAEVVAILRQKYGKRLVDVVPTTASLMYLYGDKLSAAAHVEATRQSLKQRRPQGD